ncbi:hypothetical protein S7711_10950 [Stachybotrys chartarum IBT 7711]|uniref:Uncharacterized protein n=1 Tax=Stachybotrys chartarum (strain CBS 109288 / IBT 7711) TaxID=1280523 RepID=A0A084BAW0_STACB|nr:hypothetical protein S7711_10950 [Stachybotrys chartarum IBT 7711]
MAHAYGSITVNYPSGSPLQGDAEHLDIDWFLTSCRDPVVCSPDVDETTSTMKIHLMESIFWPALVDSMVPDPVSDHKQWRRPTIIGMLDWYRHVFGLTSRLDGVLDHNAPKDPFTVETEEEFVNLWEQVANKHPLRYMANCSVTLPSNHAYYLEEIDPVRHALQMRGALTQITGSPDENGASDAAVLSLHEKEEILAKKADAVTNGTFFLPNDDTDSSSLSDNHPDADDSDIFEDCELPKEDESSSDGSVHEDAQTGMAKSWSELVESAEIEGQNPSEWKFLFPDAALFAFGPPHIENEELVTVEEGENVQSTHQGTRSVVPSLSSSGDEGSVADSDSEGVDDSSVQDSYGELYLEREKSTLEGSWVMDLSQDHRDATVLHPAFQGSAEVGVDDEDEDWVLVQSVLKLADA